MDHKEVIAQGGIEKIGLKGSFLKLTLPDGGKKILEKDIPEHTVGVEFILNTLISPEYGAIKSLDEINAVGQPAGFIPADFLPLRHCHCRRYCRHL